LAIRLRAAMASGDIRDECGDHQDENEVRPSDCRHRAHQRRPDSVLR
jgi:hypothetical protein